MRTCSVVIPWHRDLDDLRRAVASVLAQTVPAHEILVVANGVDDAGFADAAAVSDDPRYRVIRSEIAGASPARNVGLAAATGDLVFFLDADDVFLDNKLERFLASCDEQEFDIAFSRGLRQRGGGVSWPFPIGLWTAAAPLADFFFCDGGMISTTAIVMMSNWRDRLTFDETVRFCQDPDLVIRAEALGMRVRMLPDVLYQWNDDRTEGRISQTPNFDERLSWIDRLGGNVSGRARAAFKARCVAQHVFPGNFLRSLGQFRDALTTGAIPPREIMLFMLRGLLPARLRRNLLNVYFRYRAGGVTTRRADMP